MKKKLMAGLAGCMLMAACIGYAYADNINIIDATYGAGAGSFELGKFVNNGADYIQQDLRTLILSG